jgi:chemotaxis response regulator CheB
VSPDWRRTFAGRRKKVRVLICDDSLFMRAAIAKTLATGPFDIVGQAKDGNDALAQLPKLQPDVISMDFNMPGKNGADTVRAIMAARPTPVVMFSAHTKQGAKETFDALAAGAVDFVTKPAGEVSVDLSKIADELTRKLIAASVARPRAAIVIAPSRPSGAFGIPRSTMTGGLPRLRARPSPRPHGLLAEQIRHHMTHDRVPTTLRPRTPRPWPKCRSGTPQRCLI